MDKIEPLFQIVFNNLKTHLGDTIEFIIVDENKSIEAPKQSITYQFEFRNGRNTRGMDYLIPLDELNSLKQSARRR